MKRVEGKVGIITGAGQGMGKAGALIFAREGAKVVVSELNDKTGQETVEQIRKEGGEAIFAPTDVTKEDSVKNMVNLTVKTYGRLDFLYNNAGYQGPPTPSVEIKEEFWNFVNDINLKGTWLTMKYAIPQMLKTGGGSIINVSSAGGIVGLPGIAPYCAAKAGVINLTRSIALEYATQNIRINCIAPGYTDTPMADGYTGGNEQMKHEIAKIIQPMGRIGKPEEVVAMALFLASDESSFCTGACFPVDGGFTCD